MTENQIAILMKDMVTGLAYLHSQRMLHRDIKADNVLLSTEGISKLGKLHQRHNCGQKFSPFSSLADLGVAAQLTNTMDNRSTATGTPYWMAPELIMEQGYSSGVGFNSPFSPTR